jgi:hypothetical protein
MNVMHFTTHALMVHVLLHHSSFLKSVGTCPKQHSKYKKVTLERIKSDWLHSFVSARFYLSIRIDTHRAQSWAEYYRCWRRTTSGSSIAQQQGKTTCLLIDCISTIIVQYRHSLRSILTETISVMKGHNIWLKHCRTTPWDNLSSYRLHPNHYRSI